MTAITRRNLTAGLAVCAPLIAHAQAVTPLRVVAFAGASNWPMWIAEAKGFFAAERLGATLAITPNSRQMATDVFDGAYDIALTSFDNVVAYVEGQGEASLSGAADFAAFMGVDDGMLSVMGTDDVASLQALKGRTLGVDAMTTGFAFVLRHMLTTSGFAPRDIVFAAIGGGAQRLQALNERRIAGTLLNAPLDLMAEAQGARRLADARAVIGPYQGICGMARRAWLARNAGRARSFAVAFGGAVRWLTDPINKAEAIGIMRERLPDLTPELAERIHARLTDRARGIRRDLAIDRAGVETVLRLRGAYAEPRRELTDPDRYIDPSII